MAASASLERQVRTLQSALVASRGQVRQLEGELARNSAGYEGLRRRVLRLERDLLAAGVLAAIPSRDPSPDSRLTPAADVRHSLVGGVDGGDEDPLGALMARLRLPRAARAPSVVWRGSAPPRSPTPTYEPNSPLFVPTEDVVGEEGEGGSGEMDLEDEDEDGDEGGEVSGVALANPFEGW